MFRIKLGDKSYLVEEGESVLETLLRNGIKAPHTCKMAVCKRCISRVVSGDVPRRAQLSLTPKQIYNKRFLPCVCYPESDLDIEIHTTPSHPGDADHRY